MSIDARQLLQRLEPAVRPGKHPDGPSRQSSAIEDQSFAQLMSLVSRGSVSSDRTVESSSIGKPLEASQLDRLAAAADLAEASGAQRAVMLIDGRAMIMDINQRTIEMELRSESESKIINLDAAVYVVDPNSEPDMPVQPPAFGSVPPAVAEQLDRVGFRH